MQLLLLFVVALLTGCVSGPRHVASNEYTLADGNWTGTITRVSSDTGKVFEPVVVYVSICSGEARLWHKDGENYTSMTAVFQTDSTRGSHLMHAVQESDEQPGWVEIQTMLIVEIDRQTARAQWTRGVSNTELSSDKPNRTFFQHGIGDIRRIDHACNMKRVRPVIS